MSPWICRLDGRHFCFRLLMHATSNQKEHASMNTNKSASAQVSQPQLQAFPGFPYIISRIAPSLYHINLLPLDARYSFYRLRDIVRRQVDANCLRACFVLDEDKCLYLEPDGRERPSADIPRGGHIEYGKLVLCEPIPETEDLVHREEMLKLYAAPHGSAGGTMILMGDVTKGGRHPTEEEIRMLRGRQEHGVPVGLERCPRCGEWRGECFDTLDCNADLIVKVRCVCEYDTRCAGCGRPFHERRIDSNYYCETDGKIWHIPGFAALSHRCQGFL
jgi:hypothetical protein